MSNSIVREAINDLQHWRCRCPILLCSGGPWRDLSLQGVLRQLGVRQHPGPTEDRRCEAYIGLHLCAEIVAGEKEFFSSMVTRDNDPHVVRQELLRRIGERSKVVQEAVRDPDLLHSREPVAAEDQNSGIALLDLADVHDVDHRASPHWGGLPSVR